MTLQKTSHCLRRPGLHTCAIAAAFMIALAGGAVSIGGRRLSGPLSDHLVQFVQESHGLRATQRQGSGFRNVPTGQYKRLDWHLQKAEREGKAEGESSGIG